MLVMAACGCGSDGGEPPLATVEAQLGALAVNDTSIFAIDKADSKVIEIGLVDGAMIGKLPSSGTVSEVVASSPASRAAVASSTSPIATRSAPT